MAHSPKFEKVKNYYQAHLWSLKQVRDAVGKCWITAEEFEEITGQKYEA